MVLDVAIPLLKGQQVSLGRYRADFGGSYYVAGDLDHALAHAPEVSRNLHE